MLKYSKTIPVFLLLSCYASYASAVIDAYITSAARTEQSELTTPASITVITREEIENSGARHVVDVLQGRGGIQITDTYGDGSRSSVGMRGFGETANANTLVLVDGRRINNPDIASPDLNSIPLEEVERIEVVLGSAGVLFGDQAVGGVINVITQKPGALRNSLKLSAGSYGAIELHSMASQAFDNGIYYRGALNLREAENYRRHNETSYLNVSGKLGYNFIGGSAFAEIQYIDDKLNTPGTLFDNDVSTDRKQVALNFTDDFSNSETIVGRFGLAKDIGDNWLFEGELTGRNTDGVFRLSSVFGAEIQNSTQDRKILEFTPRFTGVISSWGNTALTLGVDVVESDYKLSSRFGEQINDQSQVSLYAQAVVPATQSLDITLGARYAEVENELTDGFTFNNEKITDDILVGAFGVSYQASDSWRILARADQNYRFAKVDEYTNAQPFPAPPSTIILKTQEGLSLETGVEWTNADSYAKFLIYRLDLDNELAYDPANYINVNLNETERNGLITEGRWQINNKLGVAISYALTNARITGGAFDGKDVPLVAEHSGSISSDYQFSDNWQLYGEVLLKSERPFSGDFNNGLSRLPGYGLTNIKIERTLKDFVLSARINNLFDKQYTEYGVAGTDPVTFLSREAFFPSPERNFMLTASWKFR